MHLVRLVVLGAPGVGKTTLIENFLSNCVLPLKPPFTSHPSSSSAFQEAQQEEPSKQDHQSDQDSGHPPHSKSYFFSILLNEHVLHVSVVDVPPVSFFPPSSFLEWTDFGGTSLRSADGYILVFDLTSPATFQYLKMIRDQLIESRKDMQKTPIFVVGNKADAILPLLSSASRHHHHHPHLPHHHDHHAHSHHEPPAAFKELAGLVKKQWKSSYWEVSALHNWRIQSLIFRLLEAVQRREQDLRRDHESRDHHHHHHHHRETEHGDHHHVPSPLTTSKSLPVYGRRTSHPPSNDSPHSSCKIL